MRGGGERQNGPSGKLWGGTCCGTQRRFPRIAFAHFQQAFAQIDPRQHSLPISAEPYLQKSAVHQQHFEAG